MQINLPTQNKSKELSILTHPKNESKFFFFISVGIIAEQFSKFLKNIFVII